MNLTKLESRPGPTPWSYRFFLELEGSPAEEGAGRALEEVRARALGPRARDVPAMARGVSHEELS